MELVLPPKENDGDTLQDRMTNNSYNEILPARYLSEGESQEDLFPRVAKNIAIADAVHHKNDVIVHPEDVKPDHPRREELVKEVWGDSDGGILLDEKNASKFSYERVIERAPEDVKEHMEKCRDQYEVLMSSLKFIPNSPTLMNAGDELQQLSACFVNSPGDDIGDIHQTAKEAASVFQSGGGMGYAFWELRPYGDQVGSTDGIASGPITFMRTYDQMCETIAQGGARRGAQMGVMRVSHPDVIQFIHAKNKDVSLANTLRLNDPDDFTHNSFAEALEEARDLIDDEGRVPEHLRNAVEGHLSNFNISVGITDRFMEAVKNDEEYTFTNPQDGEPHIVTEETKELYTQFGLGNHVDVGEELSVPAQEIWERIVEGAHQNGEPGIVFLERINKEHSFDVDEYPDHRIKATNPCGEQPLEEYEACNLGHINLSTLVDKNSYVQDWREFNEDPTPEELSERVEAFLEYVIDWDDFNHRIRVGTRFLENVVTMSDFPVPEIEEKVKEMRKIGLGVMGLAQLYIQLGMKYGSDPANEVARQLMTHINHHSKQVSRELSIERGVFGEWEKSKYASPLEYPEWFESQTGEDPEYWDSHEMEIWDGDEYISVTGYPIRNHNTTTIAPTGTTSMVGNTTGGCEPIYNVAYFKNVSGDIQGEEMLVEFDDYFLRVLEANGINVESVKDEAKEQMRNNAFDGIGGLSNVPDEIGELFVTTDDLVADDHVSVQCACQEGVDSAISKTVNAPNEATIDDARQTFEYAYDNGAKGVTYYRDGTRNKQVKTTRANNSKFSDEGDVLDTVDEKLDEDPNFEEELLDLLSADVIVDYDEPWYENNHYAEKRDRPQYLHGVTPRVKTGYGHLYVTVNVDNRGRPFEIFGIKGESGSFESGFVEAIAKSVSTALRSGVDPEELADDLIGIRAPKVGFDDSFGQVQSIPDAIGKALKKVTTGEVPLPRERQNTKTEVTDGGQQLTQHLTQHHHVECWCDNTSDQLIVQNEGCKECKSCGWSKC